MVSWTVNYLLDREFLVFSTQLNRSAVVYIRYTLSTNHFVGQDLEQIYGWPDATVTCRQPIQVNTKGLKSTIKISTVVEMGILGMTDKEKQLTKNTKCWEITVFKKSLLLSLPSRREFCLSHFILNKILHLE